MDKNYCVLTLKKIHSMGSLQISYKHNFREMKLNHIDVMKSDKNEELVNQTGMDYRDLWYRRIKEVEVKTGAKIPIRKNSVLAYEVVTTYSREAEVDVDAWCEANVKWMKETFGEDNVLSMQLHQDETVPHIHAIVIPIDERGKLCAKSFTGGRAKMFKLQTSYGKAMEPFGLSRGEMYTHTKKNDLQRFYASVNNAVGKEAPTREENETVESYMSRVNRYIQDESMASLWERNTMQRKAEVQHSRFTQFHAKYGEAIRLQDDLEELFDGDMDAVKERLRSYRKIEQSVPKNTLKKLLDSILEKFPFKGVLKEPKNKFQKEKGDSETQTETGVGK